MRGLGDLARPLFFMHYLLSLALAVPLTAAQTPPRRTPLVDPAKTAGLLETGHCPEGLRLVKKAYAGASDSDLKRRLGAGGVRCAMSLNDVNAAAELIQSLSRDFPRDPDVL